MCNLSEWIVREAFLAYDRGDIHGLMKFVHPDLEWAHLDPALEDPVPVVQHGREKLEASLRRQQDRGLHVELEEVVAAGDQVILVLRLPGIDGYRHRKAGDLTYDIVTVRDGLIVGLRDCRDHTEARSLAGIG